MLREEIPSWRSLGLEPLTNSRQRRNPVDGRFVVARLCPAFGSSHPLFWERVIEEGSAMEVTLNHEGGCARPHKPC
jgi:hypothetical protein